MFQNKIALIESAVKSGSPPLEKVNEKMKIEIETILGRLPLDSSKLLRLKAQIEKILISPNNIVKQIKLESPTLFCRTEPVLGKKFLKEVIYNSISPEGQINQNYQDVFEWDSQNRTKDSDPLE